MVHDLDEKSFRELIFDYENGDTAPMSIEKNTIIEYYVTWCPHCQAMAPRFEKISKEFPEVSCCRVDMEQHPYLAELFEIDSFPTFIFISKEGHMERWVGELPVSELAGMVRETFGKKR